MANPENLKGKGFDKRPENINRKGQPKKIPSLDVLLADIFGDKEMTALIKAMEKEALKGNVRAFDSLADRIYGRVKQDIGVTGMPPTTLNIIVDKSETGEMLKRLRSGSKTD